MTIYLEALQHAQMYENLFNTQEDKNTFFYYHLPGTLAVKTLYRVA
jgi:hypothetical protein